MKVFKSVTGWSIVSMACLSIFFLSSCKSKDTLTDPQIASIAVTANQIDVDYAKLALQKSTNPDVTAFAQSMQKDHENIIQQATALAQKLGVTPEDNPTTQSLLSGEKEVMSKLNGLSGHDFDTAYINNEVAYHRAVISTVKDKLIPDATNKDLKDLLTSVTPLLGQHLQMAIDDSGKVANASAANVPTLTDPESASVAVTANQIDVRYGQLALKKSKNADVRAFAQTMIKDHNNIINQAVALAKKLNVTPKDNPVTQSLLKGEKDVDARFAKLSGHDFDTAYINNEVAYHAAVIGAVKTVLIPQIQNADLKKMLIDVSPLLEEHLKMAKEDQQKILNSK